MNAAAVGALRQRKFRKERPFALMVRNIEITRRLLHLSAEGEVLMESPARPIVLAQARVELPDVAPDNSDLGVMLPYAPVHHLLFAAGSPDVLVMTSANRSNEPIAYLDDDAVERLAGIADAFLIGERPIARRVDDSIVRAGALGPAILRRSRGYAPGAIATFPRGTPPVLALGADLKNAITLVVDGHAFVSQHIGDLDQHPCRQAFKETIGDLLEMYKVDSERMILAHDLHPEYASTAAAGEIQCAARYAVQHHRAHIASVLAERGAWDQRVIGVSFDGTGYGDDGTIWGGEFFAGDLPHGFDRVMHLRGALLPGGDAAARFPVQCAAGFVFESDAEPNLCAAPFFFPERYRHACRMLRSGARSFRSSSVGRLFDAAAALLGFTREVTFEGQAAMWLEQQARRGRTQAAYCFPISGSTLDFRPLLEDVIEDRRKGRDVATIARSFQLAIASGVAAAVRRLSAEHSANVCVLSGGVFQNEMLLCDVKTMLQDSGIELWSNSQVPANDGGISLGQAALAVFQHGARNA